MAHYAFLDVDNIVTEVIVGKDENENNIDWELYYTNIKGQTCKRTSFNTIGGAHKNGETPFRKNYAGIGYTYDSIKDAFIPPKPYDSWVLNEDSCLWGPPVNYPNDGNEYIWNEENKSWDLITE